jgi:hypothetical protein
MYAAYIYICTYMLQSKIMEVPITQFRLKLFDLVNQALEGKEVWVSHKGRRVRIVPEDAPSKLSRVTPMDIIAPGVNIDDDSWKTDLMSDWEQKWDRRLGPAAKSVRSAPAKVRAETLRARRKS